LHNDDIKKDDVGRIHSTQGEMRKAQIILVQKLVRPRRRREENTAMDVREIKCERLDGVELAQTGSNEFCEASGEADVSI
jgi:hypothetical protein